jgi:hypothetical protein
MQSSPIVAIDPRFVLEQEVVLCVKSKMMNWSGDDYIIKDTEGVLTVVLLTGISFAKVEVWHSIVPTSQEICTQTHTNTHRQCYYY